jgi:outer membrane protein assembly factor BamA
VKSSGPPLVTLALCATTLFFISSPMSAQTTAKLPSRCSDYADPVKGLEFFPLVIDDVKLDGTLTMPLAERQRFVASLVRHEKCVTSDWLDEIEEIETRNFWEDRGYFKVAVTADANILDEHSATQHAVVTVHIKEGIQYRLKQIRFRKAVDPDDTSPFADRPSFPSGTLRTLIPLEDGDLFRTNKIREGIDALNNFYRSYGYIDFVATPFTDIDDEKHEISLIMEMSESKQFRISKVEVLGHAPAALRALPNQFVVGEVLDAVSLKAAAKKIEASAGCASERSVQTRKNMHAGTVEITFDFRPCPLPDH